MFTTKFLSSSLVLCFLLCSAWAKSAFSQNTFSELELSGIYSSELDIVNGNRWYYENNYKGHPFFYDDDLFEGSVIFNGINFSQLTLTYELLNNELILIKEVGNQTRELILNENFVESFVLEGTGNSSEYVFIRKKLPGVEGEKYYHSVYNGETACYIYHKKVINNRVTGNYLGEYLYRPVLYIKRGDEFQGCNNKRTFLRLFEDQKKQIRKYIRRNNMHIDGKNPEDIAQVLKYYDSLNQKLNE
jgi:hypothetical protein